MDNNQREELISDARRTAERARQELTWTTLSHPCDEWTHCSVNSVIAATISLAGPPI